MTIVFIESRRALLISFDCIVVFVLSQPTLVFPTRHGIVLSQTTLAYTFLLFDSRVLMTCRTCHPLSPPLHRQSLLLGARGQDMRARACALLDVLVGETPTPELQFLELQVWGKTQQNTQFEKQNIDINFITRLPRLFSGT